MESCRRLRPRDRKRREPLVSVGAASRVRHYKRTCQLGDGSERKAVARDLRDWSVGGPRHGAESSASRTSGSAALLVLVVQPGRDRRALGWCPLGLSERQRPSACGPSRVRRSASTFVTAESAPASHPSSWQSATRADRQPRDGTPPTPRVRDWRLADQPNGEGSYLLWRGDTHVATCVRAAG
jgi:hypothetical protein